MSTLGPHSLPQKAARSGSAPLFLIAGGGMLALLTLLAVAAPLISPLDPETVEVRRVLGAPDLTHLFGSDVLGRDVLSRIIHALRVSLLVSVTSVLASLAVAVPVGLTAGYFGGWADTAISRTVDMILVLPAMLLAITFVAILGPGSMVATLAIAVIYLPILARVMRTSALVVVKNDYVAGARARGAGHLRIILQHVAPNAFGPVIVQASVLCAFALQLEAGLSFLGLGAQPPTPSLGGMLSEGRDVLNQAPWVEIFPGAAIVIAVLAFSFLGEGLRRAFDPHGVTG